MEDQPGKLDPSASAAPVLPLARAADLAAVTTIERTLTIARNAAQRLLDARNPLEQTPENKLAMLDLIDRMAKTPGKFGVMLMPWEKQALRVWSRFQRHLWANEAEPEPAQPA